VGELFQQLRGKTACRRSPIKAVKLAGSGGYVFPDFPDVTVVCGKPEYLVKRGIGRLLNPSVVVEVMSSSTALDETDKLPACTAIRTNREYLVVSRDRCAVKLFFRQTGPSARGFGQVPAFGGPASTIPTPARQASPASPHFRGARGNANADAIHSAPAGAAPFRAAHSMHSAK
jgi:Putative restriction endonuclease